MRSGLQAIDLREPIPFFCECDRADCFATVWLSGRAYDRLRTRPDRALSAHRRRRFRLISA